MEVTLEHMLMDVFVSLPTLNYPSIFFFSPNNHLQLCAQLIYLSLPLMIAVCEQGPTYVHIYFQMFCH